MSQKDDRLWLTRSEAAEICGLSARQFDEVLRQRADDAERGSGKTLRFHGPAIVAALLAYRLEQAKPAGDGDELMVGESPVIDEYRRVKTAQERIKLSLLEQTAIPRTELEPALSAFAGVLRRAGETLKRSYGDDAASVLNDAVGEAVSAWERMLANVLRDPSKQSDVKPAELDGRAGPGAAAQDDAPLRGRRNRDPGRPAQGAAVPVRSKPVRRRAAGCD
jgi:hypothetical protein